MFGSLCVMCVKCTRAHTHIHPAPPGDDGCDRMLTTLPDRCDKCSNTFVSKQRVCNFLEGAPQGTDVVIFIVNEKWMDRDREREREEETEDHRGVGNTAR